MDKHKSNIPSCKPLSFKGKVLYYLVKVPVQLISILFDFNSQKPLELEENPSNMTKKELLFFAYKYYVKNISGGHQSKYLKLPKASKKYKYPQGEIIKINIGGDLMPYKQIKKEKCQELWSERGAFFNADIVVANLETPIDTSIKPQLVPEVMLGHMNFNSSEEQFDIFNGNGQHKGFDVLSLANNHSLDMGYSGLQNTMKFLEERNIGYCGVGKGRTDYCIKKKGIHVGFISYTYCLNHHTQNPNSVIMINELPLNNPKINDIKLIQEEAQKLRENGVEFIIALLHAGNAYQPYPSIYTEQLYKKIAEDTEVDFIVGGHPHNIQPLQEFETKRGPVIAAYSLADFIAYDIYQRCHLSLYLELELTKTSKGVSLQHLKVHSNYMSYENDELVLKNFDKIRETKNTDKKIADLQMLYRQTIQVN